MAVYQGEIVLFNLEHAEGTEECAVAAAVLRDLVGRDRADVMPDEYVKIFESHRAAIEKVALAKLKSGDHDGGGILVTSKDMFG